MKKKLLALVCALVMIFSLASCGLSTPDTVGKVGDFEVSSGLYLLAQFSAYQQAAQLAGKDQDATDVKAFLKETITTDADNQCCQQTYMDRYVQTGGKKDLSKVKENLDHQMGTNRVNYWTWIDAIQMAMPAYAKYAKITGERKYLDYAMNSYKWSRDTLANGLFNKKEGLWWRDKDYVPPYKEKDGSNCYWSRGNGWVYAALVRVMETLPKTDKYYKYLKKDFILMSKAILKCQREDGYWNVSLVCPANYGGPEMTGTGLFLYGMAWGVQQGILPRATYQKAMDKAWKALAASVHEDGFIGYNQGTGKDPAAGQPVTFTSVPDFEDYGTGCLLLGAAEYYKLVKVKK